MRSSTLERGAWACGGIFAVVFVAAQLDAGISSRIAIARFHSTATVAQAEPIAIPDPHSVDFSLWSSDRVDLYHQTLEDHSGAVMAVLEVPSIGLEVPVFEGTDERTLNRGLGHIAGTALPGDSGNLGLAGHRDGFLRALADVEHGHEIHLITHDGRQTYRVDQILIVDPDDVSVLHPRGRPTVTLVTCYPFYFIGSAPERYIVRASLIEPQTGALPAAEE